MIKTLTNLFKQDKEKFVVPKGVQDVIPVVAIFDDGIFKVGKDKYSKRYISVDSEYRIKIASTFWNIFFLIVNHSFSTHWICIIYISCAAYCCDICSANWPTPPDAPWTKTSIPEWIFAFLQASIATIPAVGNAAASSKDKLWGLSAKLQENAWF